MSSVEPLVESLAEQQRERIHADILRAELRLSCATASEPRKLEAPKTLGERSAHAQA